MASAIVMASSILKIIGVMQLLYKGHAGELIDEKDYSTDATAYSVLFYPLK